MSLLLTTIIVGSAILPTRNEEVVTIKPVWYETSKEAREHCYSIGAWGNTPRELVDKQRYVGCAVFDPSTKFCTIHVVRPKYVDDLLTTMLGHEVLHCFLGRYHQ